MQLRKLLAIALLCLLSACGKGMDGTWADAMGASRYHFQSNGTVTVEVMGTSQVLDYTRDGERLELQLADGTTLDFTLAGDGALQGPLGIRLEKVDSPR